MIWFKQMKNKPLICGIIAVGPNNVIGHNGVMPWYNKQDLYVFKNRTVGYPCIFGKTTYENLPKKPLPGRLNIVCSSSYKIEKDGDVLRVPSLEEAIKQCGNTEQVFVCGGAVLYKYALEHDLIDVMYLTKIQDNQLKQNVAKNPDAYTYFSYNFDPGKWAKMRIDYPPRLLPAETSATRAVFYKYIRIR